MTASGGIVADGTYSVQFKLYNVASGGTAQWTETQGTVQVKSGYLSVYLGSTTPFPGTIDWSQEQWLTMNVNGDGEMTPRLKLTAVPYAFKAGQADTLTITGGTVTGDNLAQLAPAGTQSVNSTVAGLRINQIGSGGLLQLAAGGVDQFTISNAGDGALAGTLSVSGSTLSVGGPTQTGLLVLNNGAGGNSSLQANASGLNLTSAGDISIGTSDATATLLILDTKTTATDPAGTNGAMYYNSNLNRFRCYQNGQWQDCINGANNNSTASFISGLANAPANTTGTPVKMLVFTSATAVSNTAGITGFTAPASGSFRTCLVKNNANLTAGTLDLRWRVNGVSVGSPACQMSTTNNRQSATALDPGVVTFNAGDTIGVAYDTVGLAPTTTEYTAYWTIEYNATNVASNAATIQSAYNNSTSPELILDSTRGALSIRDNAAPIGGALFEIQDNTGVTTYFDVSASGTLIANGLSISSGNVNVASGTVTATGFSGDGSALTSLDASQLSSGTVNDSRLSSNVLLLNASQTLTGTPTFGAGLVLGNSTSTTAGTLRWNGTDFEGYNGTTWVQLSGGTASGPLTVTSIQAFDNTGGTDLNTSTPTAVPWDAETRKDTDFTHSNTVSNTRIYMNNPGWYKVSYNISGANQSANRNTVFCQIRLDGTTYNSPSGSYSYSRDTTNASATNTASVYVHTTTANQYYEVMCSQSGSAGAQLAEAGRSWTIAEKAEQPQGAAATTFENGGNSFGNLATLGTNDAFGLDLVTSGLTRMTITDTGDVDINNVLNVDGGLQIGGTNVLTAGRVLQNVTADTNILTSGILGNTRGGTGLDTSGATNGQLLIGNGSGFTLASLTNGGGLTITPGAGSLGLAVAYGSGANTAVQGNTGLTCPSGTGNLTGGGTAITLGAGGTCGAISTINNPTFTTSVTSPIFTGSAGVTLSSGGTGDLTLDSASNKLVIAGTDTTWQRTATGAFTLDLNDTGATTFTLNNSGTGAASLNLTDGGLQVAGTSVLGNNRALSNLTGIASSGTITFSALNTGGIVKADTSGNLSVATGGTDYEFPLTFSNGLTRSTNSIKLGGNLTGATDIGLNGNALTITGSGGSVFTAFAAGGIDIKNDSTAALAVRNTAGTLSYLTVNANGNIVQTGSATTDATAVLNVLDSYNGAGDPTGVNGAQYYRTSDNKFRCFQNNIWVDCNNGYNTITKTADQAATQLSTTFQNDNTLKFSVNANTTYVFDALIPVNDSNTAADLKYTFTTPTGATLNILTSYYSTVTAATQCNIVASAQSCVNNAVNRTDHLIQVRGQVTVAGTAGTVQFQFAQNAAAAVNFPVIKKGATMSWHQSN